MKNKSDEKNQKGQALLFVVVAMTVALTVGVAVTSQTLSSIRRTSSTDTSSRVLSAAEGGIEWFLKQPTATLENLADGNTIDPVSGDSQCPSGTSSDSTNNSVCILNYEPQAEDKVQSKAVLSVSTFSFNDTASGSENYWFSLTPGDVKEVRLTNENETSYYSGDLDLCWKSQEPSNTSGIYYLTYSMDGIIEKNLISPASTGSGTYSVSGGVTASPSGKPGYDSCYKINIAVDTYGIRMKSLYAPSKIAIFPSNPSAFPSQGYKIISKGTLAGVSENTQAVKVITVYRAYAFAPSSFDYALYATSALE